MNMYSRNFESLGQYHDFLATILVSAPDKFRSWDDRLVNQQVTLNAAFDTLRSGFHFAERKVKDARTVRILRELIEMSYEAYVKGDAKTGAHTLQEYEGMIWPSYRQPVKYAVEAERRAFGELEMYADVIVSPYPFEGTEQDLSPEQSKLYAVATARCLTYFDRREDFKPFVLLLETEGAVRELKFRSWKSAQTEIRDLAVHGQIICFARTEVVASGMSGLVIYTLESTGKPQVSARALVKNYSVEPPKFHLDQPVVLR